MLKSWTQGGLVMESTPLLERSNTGDVYKIETPPPVLHVHTKGKPHCIFIIRSLKAEHASDYNSHSYLREQIFF